MPLTATLCTPSKVSHRLCNALLPTKHSGMSSGQHFVLALFSSAVAVTPRLFDQNLSVSPTASHAQATSKSDRFRSENPGIGTRRRRRCTAPTSFPWHSRKTRKSGLRAGCRGSRYPSANGACSNGRPHILMSSSTRISRLPAAPACEELPSTSGSRNPPRARSLNGASSRS